MKIYLWKPKLFSIAVAVMGAIAWGTVSAQGVVDTKHNLGTTAGADKAATFSGTGEICVFCHTPHGSDTTAAVPLWNKALPVATTFTTYNSTAATATTSIDGEIVDVGSVSIACLSCHDGVQAMDSVINAPGSGLAGNATWQGGAWTLGNLDGVMTGVAALGQDLTDDHPIGVQYGGGGITATNVNGTLNDGDFKTTLNDTINGTTVWWVETGGNTTREKTDMQLYTRIAGTITEAQPFVECASCHDPHSSANDTFLRIPNTGSAVCLACHTK